MLIRMSDMQHALRRPVTVERITIDPAAGGQPRLRDTDVLVADLVFELGPEALSDEDVLVRHPELEEGDLHAVRVYADEVRTPLELDVLLRRVFGADPTHDDVLAAYLSMPRIVMGYHEHAHLGVPMKVRSSFEAVSTDAASARGTWLAALGDLVFLDQVGTALTRTDHEDISRKWKISSPERALERFSDLAERERAALYALRNALGHDFSLVNRPDTSHSERREQLQHAFVLHHDAQRPLIEFPDTMWDGEPMAVHETYVHLGHLTELTDRVRARIFEVYDSGNLRLVESAEETRRRYFFTHEALTAEWEDQRRTDNRARWGDERYLAADGNGHNGPTPSSGLSRR